MSELKPGFDIQSICDVREATGLLLHSLYVGGNALRCIRINHIHMFVTMPQIAYNALYGTGKELEVNETERKALVDTIIQLIEAGNYDLHMAGHSSSPMSYFTSEILYRDAPSPVHYSYDETTVTISLGGSTHVFNKRDLFVRDSYALKHVLDTLGIPHALLS